MPADPARKLPVPVTEAQPKSAEAIPFDLIPETRKKTKSVLGTVADYFEISTPNILDGDYPKSVNSYDLKDGESVTTCLEAQEGHTTNNVVLVDPANDSFAVIQGLGGTGAARDAAKEYAKAFEEYKNPFRGQVEAEKNIIKYRVHGGASYMYGKIVKGDNGEKYLWTGSLGDDVICAVYDKYGADKTRPNPDENIPLKKGDRVLIISKQMGLTPDDIFGLMVRPTQTLKPVNKAVKAIRKATKDKPCDQAFVLMEIK